MKVCYTRRALNDLADINAYVRQHSPKGAARVGARIRKRIDDLKRFPGQGKPAPNGLRLLVVTQTRYIVVYAVTDTIEVLRIYHSARNQA